MGCFAWLLTMVQQPSKKAMQGQQGGFIMTWQALPPERIALIKQVKLHVPFAELIEHLNAVGFGCAQDQRQWMPRRRLGVEVQWTVMRVWTYQGGLQGWQVPQRLADEPAVLTLQQVVVFTELQHKALPIVGGHACRLPEEFFKTPADCRGTVAVETAYRECRVTLIASRDEQLLQAVNQAQGTFVALEMHLVPAADTDQIQALHQIEMGAGIVQHIATTTGQLRAGQGLERVETYVNQDQERNRPAGL